MLEIIGNGGISYVVAGGAAVTGVVSKVISNLALKRMVYAAGNMSKSNHPLMRLVRAKFEHACMVSEKVENVGVFVDKYLYEHKTLGLRLHTWRRMEKLMAFVCLVTGLLGAFFEYFANGMNEHVIRIGAYGGILGILVYLFHLTTDENYRLNAARTYMVDYLENVCLHKYEKLHQKDSEQEPVRPQPVKEVPVTEPVPELVPEPQEVPDVTPPIKASVKEEAKPQPEKERKPDKDVLIRQILEEFMA